MKKIFVLICLSAFVISCGNKPDSPNSADSALPTASTELTLKEKQDKAAFVVEAFEDTSLLVPHSKISVDYNDTRTVIDDIPGIATIEEGGSYESPADAISVCGCWYAGGGDWYYIARTETGIAIYHGWQDEMQEDEGYHWEEMKQID